MKKKLVAFFTKLTFLFALPSTPAYAELETLARFDRTTPPGNVAVTPQGRIIMSLHQFYPTNI